MMYRQNDPGDQPLTLNQLTKFIGEIAWIVVIGWALDQLFGFFAAVCLILAIAVIVSLIRVAARGVRRLHLPAIVRSRLPAIAWRPGPLFQFWLCMIATLVAFVVLPVTAVILQRQ